MVRVLSLVAVVLWLILLAGIFIHPCANASVTLGEDLIRHTVRLALLYYAAAATLMLLMRPEEWTAATGRGALARLCWSLAWLAYLVHLAMAFHHYHGWSHAHAVEHTREVSGVGEGIFVSHLFTLLWSGDVLFWWLRPARYAARPRWIDVLLHGFMVFVIFNGTVVYETGLIRWLGLLMFAELAAVVILREWRHRDLLTASGSH